MKLSLKHSALIIILMTGVSFAQVATGTPAFGSFGGGPFDVVNLGNLNVHMDVPVLHKAGRGIPFTYDLTYDSSIWTPVTSGGVTQWQPATVWGWNIATAASSGYVTQNVVNSVIVGHPCNIGETTYSNYVYHDPFGKSHVFVTNTTSPTPITTWVRVNPCGHSTTYSGYVTGVASDGSGYSISAQYVSWKVTASNGTVVVGPTNSNYGSGSFTDVNGNQITANSSNQYFDTLSSTTPVITVGGSGTSSSPNTFTYAAPSGASASYTMNYTQYTVSTNFGVSSISEYGPTSVPLVSSIQLPDLTSYSFTYEATPGSCTPLGSTYSGNCVTGRIASVTLPTGGTITYTYSGGSSGTGIYSDGSAGNLTRVLSPSTSCTSGCWQYTRALLGSTPPGPGSAWTTTVTDPQSNQTVLNFAEDGAASSSTTVATYTLYETQRKAYQGSSTLLATRITCYNASYSSCATASSIDSPISQTDTYTVLPSGSTRLSEVAYNGSFTASGLVSDDREYDYGVSMGSAPGTTHLVQETVTNYASLGNGIINQASSVVTNDWTSGSAVTIASTSYSYDGTPVTSTSGTPQHISITGSRGNLTTLATQTNSSSTMLYQTYSYYDTGNVNVATDVSTSSSSPGPSTTYGYGYGSCGNSFATSVNEPLSLSRSVVWNCTGGVATSATDENGRTVSANYSTDPDFWRPSSTTDQAGNATSMTYSGQTSSESALTFNSGNSVSDVISTLDGFGRPILSQVKQGPSATTYDSSQTTYNSMGQSYQSTMPFSATAGTTSGSAPNITTTHDALGRVTKTEDANGGYTSFTYTNNDVVQTVSSTASGAQSFSKQLEYDGLGRLSSVCEMSTTLSGVGTCGQNTTQTGYWTKYTYDALGHLLTVTQNAQASSGSQQARSYAFDWIGRLTSESNPETSNSGSNGTTYYTYDVASGSCSASAGNMTKRVDNAGNTTCYSYDSLHRMTDAGNTGTCRHFRYDTSATPPASVSVSNTLARAEEAFTTNCSTTLLTDEWFSYSVRGELTDVYESTPNSGGYYHTTAAYWPSGALSSLSGIPSVPTIYYGAGGSGLDGEGRYTVVSDGSSINPVTGVTYSSTSTTNPLGALTGVTYGSGDSDSFTYDPKTGRQSSYTFSVNGSTDVGSLTWNANGTLAQLAISDSISGTSDSQTCGYTYDDLGRVGGQDSNGYSVDCGSAWQQLFTYDPFGNIQKSGSLNFAASYTPASNQFTLGGATVTYDGNGNLTNDNLNSYTWDPNWGTMQSVTDSGTTATATYDALSRVVEQYDGLTYTQTLYSPFGKTALMSGTSLTKAFVSLPGSGTAVYSASGIAYYRHADWLGSSRLASTSSQTLDSSSAYAPFGEQYATAGATDASFTGQDSDTVPDIYDFMARRLSPSQGRWTSPDPLGLAAADPTRPQTWNRYAYVAGNPLSFVDPLGMYEQYPCNPSGPNCGPDGGPSDPADDGTGVDPSSLPDELQSWGITVSGQGYGNGYGGWGGSYGIPYPGLLGAILQALSLPTAGECEFGVCINNLTQGNAQGTMATASTYLAVAKIAIIGAWDMTKFLFEPSCKSLDNEGDALKVVGAAAAIYKGLGAATVATGGADLPYTGTAVVIVGGAGGVGTIEGVAAKHHVGCHD